jgi:hypothetical protein
MIQALMWKEYREHRAVWLTLAAVSAAGMFGLTRLMAPEGLTHGSFANESLQAVAVLLAWTYGLVCGSMLLAIERESATLDFLDMLPVHRLTLWFVKCAIGVLLLLGHVAVLFAVVVALDISADGWELAATLAAMVCFGLYSMSWALLFSARGESVLNVIGLAIVGQAVGGIGTGILIVPLVKSFNNRPGIALLVVAFVCLAGIIALAVGPAVLSARAFSQTDRLRRRAAPRVRARAVDSGLTGSWVRLLWLTYSQMRRLLLGLTIFSLSLGFLVPVAGPVAWPFLTLLIGVLCGVTIYGDEQMHGSFRFLGDQRFPLGRVWVVKVGMRFALAVFAAFLLLLPSLCLTLFHRAQARPHMEQPPFFGEVLHSTLVGPIVPTTLHLTMWLLFGFTAGHLCGLLFRKSLVAAVLGLGVSATLASFWVPSLLGIGLHFWQVMGVPALLLAVGGALVPAWAADRLLARGTFLSLGAALTAIGLWIAGGLWYRVAEIPDVPDQFDMPAFEASIPPPEENEAGSKIRGAASQVNEIVKAFWNRQSAEPRRLVPGDNRQHPPGQAGRKSFFVQLVEAEEGGWPAGRSDLGDWLDQEVFQGDWYQKLADAADQPLGVADDPKHQTFGPSLDKWGSLGQISHVLAVRGLQLQARGDPGAFVDNLHIGLSLARNLQNAAPFSTAQAGRRADMVWQAVLDRWLEKLRGHPDLLRRALAILLRHEAELPDEEDSVKADYLVLKNTLEQQPDTLVRMNTPHRDREEPQLWEAEVKTAALLWLIPWEQDRHRRMLRVAFQGDNRERLRLEEWGGAAFASLTVRTRVRPRAKREIARMHANQLEVALRLYQAEQGKPAETLDVLVPRYLPSIPLDPFSGKPFRYRLSRGERVDWFGVMTGEDIQAMQEEPQAPQPPGLGVGMPAGMVAAGATPPKLAFRRLVPKGQGILWSVGEDGHDDGGKRQGTLDSNTQFGEDILYLVPLPAK